jgi:hypothetical protein
MRRVTVMLDLGILNALASKTNRNMPRLSVVSGYGKAMGIDIVMNVLIAKQG